LEGAPVTPVTEGAPLSPAAQQAFQYPVYDAAGNPINAATYQPTFAGATPNVPANLPEGGFPGDTVSSLPGSPTTPVETGALGPPEAPPAETPVAETPSTGGGIGSDYVASGGQGPGGTFADAAAAPTSQPVEFPQMPQSAPSSQAADALGGNVAQGAGTAPTTESISSWWKSLSPTMRTSLMSAPALIVAGINLAKGPQNQQQLDALNAQAQQDQALYQQQIGLYNSGQIPPGQALSISQWLKAQKNKINQEYSAMNRYQSTDRLKAISQAETAATAQFQSYLDQELKTANLASNQAAQDLAAAAKVQAANDAAFSSAALSALGGVGKIAATALL